MFHERMGKVKGMNAKQSEFEKFLAEEIGRNAQQTRDYFAENP